MTLVSIEALKKSPQDTDLFVATWGELVMACESEARQTSGLAVAELARIALLDESTRMLVNIAHRAVRDGPIWRMSDSLPDTGGSCWDEGFLVAPMARTLREAWIFPGYSLAAGNHDPSVPSKVVFSERVHGTDDWEHHDLHLQPGEGRADPITTRMIDDVSRKEMSIIAGYALGAV